MHILLYGPPGSGKTTLGAKLAASLMRPFTDLDEAIQQQAGSSITAIFEQQGEPAFRQLESEMLAQCLSQTRETVIALGGGALLAPANRQLAETQGQVLCLTAARDVLVARLTSSAPTRPLLAGDLNQRMQTLLAQRQAHYASFVNRLNTDGMDEKETLWQAQVLLGTFHITGMNTDCDLRIRPGSLTNLGKEMQQCGLKGPVVLVSDDNVAALYGQQAQNSLEQWEYQVTVVTLPSGETHKHIHTVARIWESCAAAGLERGSTIVALGGGVVGDQAGFAAATFLRGLPWVNVPTSLLAMVDSSLGGKTGANLPQGKNLIGAFHAPRLVLIDPDLLHTLPEAELRSGLGETVKHGVIADPQLFELCATGVDAIKQDFTRLVRQAAAVKVKIILQDPYENDLRQALNLGHTIGHGVELACGLQISHGEAVAIGMIAEARLAEQKELAKPGLADQLRCVLRELGLQTELPEGIDLQAVVRAMKLDKKRADGLVRFALPIKVGEVRVGVVVPDWENWILKQNHEEN
jgi:3-dehydroquinate synthase